MKHFHILRPVNSPPLYDIGLGFRKLRQSRQCSQQAVADALEISRNSYMAWEANKVDITLTSCIAFCDVFSISLMVFLTVYAAHNDHSAKKNSA